MWKYCQSKKIQLAEEAEETDSIEIHIKVKVITEIT
jgi:hypothetical protein